MKLSLITNKFLTKTFFMPYAFCLLLSSCASVTSISTKVSSISTSNENIQDAVNDLVIQSRIKQKLLVEEFKDLYCKISVDVSNGRVMYTGTVKQHEDMNKAIQIAWNTKGVTEVVNELKIDENSTYFDSAQYAQDLWITAQLKTKILFHKNLKISRYTVVTTNGIVYLFGFAHSQNELNDLTHTAAQINGVEKVINGVVIR